MTLSDKIYEAVKKIPKGKVATYGQIATMCGNPYYARAVGNALHKNPDPANIPCHRVVNSLGCLTKSFVFGGINEHAIRLENEGVIVKDNKVDLKIYQWRGNDE